MKNNLIFKLNRTKGVDVEVDVTEENPEMDSFEQMEDGSISFGSPSPPVDDTDFSANLADAMDDSDLNSVKNDLMGNVEDDKESRSDWEKTYREGLSYHRLFF